MKQNRILSFVLALVMTVGTLIAGASVSAEESLYKDVKTSRWSYEDIKYVTENGLMTGTGNGKFAPAETMTRAMVVTVLYRLEGSPEVSYISTFTDVKKGTWYTDAVLWAAKNGIVNGVGNKLYKPMEDVTREQLATIIMRYAEDKLVIPNDTVDITGYTDYGKIHDYARDAMAWANAIGLITGVTATTLEPRGGATREQFAAILRRYTEKAPTLTYKLKYNFPSEYSKYTEKDYPLVTDADIYVSVDGNDANPGTTVDKPVASFEKAVQLVRELKKTATDEIKVAFKAGNYGRVTVNLTEEDSGTEEVPITYCAYGDGDVIFQNGITVTEDMFKPLDEADKAFFADKHEDSIKKVELESLLVPGDELSKESQLVNNGQRMNQARFPNLSDMGYYEELMPDPDDKMGLGNAVKVTDFILAKKISSYHTLENVELIGRIAQPYLFNVQSLKSWDAETGKLEFTEYVYQGTGNYTNQSSFISNASEELDRNYEYWVDTDGKTLYVYKPDTDYVLTTQGTYITTSADYVSFVGFEFRGSSDGFFNINADHVTVKLCDMYVGGGKFAIMAYGNYITVSECELSYLAGGGIFLEGSLEDIDNLVSGECVIDNNSIHDFELKYKVYLPGVRLYNTVGAVISHNEIYNASHSGIIYGHAAEGDVYMPDKAGGRGIDNIIEYNALHHLVQSSSDAGGIYSDRSVANPDNIIRYNIIAEIGDYSIYLGDACAGQQIYGNLFYCGGSIKCDGRANTVRDNVMVNSQIEYGTKYRGMYLGDGEPSIDNVFRSPTWWTFYYSVNLIPAEGNAARDKWAARWPNLIKLKTDMSLVEELIGDIDFIINPSYCDISDNITIGKENMINEDVSLFSKVESNLEYSIDENPVFVNPTLGDYSIREDADFFKIPFKEIGRY